MSSETRTYNHIAYSTEVGGPCIKCKRHVRIPSPTFRGIIGINGNTRAEVISYLVRQASVWKTNTTCAHKRCRV